MKYLFKALKDIYDADSDLTGACNGFYYDHATQGITLPYIVVSVIAINPERYLEASSLRYDTNMLLQFSIYDDSSSIEDVIDIYNDINDAFDNTDITISGWTNIAFLRESTRAPFNLDGIWSMSADFRWHICRNVGFGEGGFGEGGFGEGGFG